MTIILIVVFVICLVLTALGDAAQIRLMNKQSKRDQFIWHASSALIRSILLFAVIYLTGVRGVGLFKNWFLFQVLWWINFDLFLNILRRRYALYVGQTDIIDISIRKIANKVGCPPESTGLTLKLIILLIALII